MDESFKMRSVSGSTTVLHDRGNTSVGYSLLFMCVIVTALLILGSNRKMDVLLHDIGASFILYNGALFVGCLLCRISLLGEEWRHLATRYRGYTMIMIRRAFSFNAPSVCFGILSLFMLFLFFATCKNISACFKEIDWKVQFGILIICAIVHKQLDVHQSALTKSIMLEKMDGLHYGSGMAYGFFYGYLNIVLPNHGHSESQSLKERVEDFVLDERLDDSHFPVKKLLILVPSSAYLPGNLKELSQDGRIEEVKKRLKPVKLNRGGTMGRTYENTVYRIKTRKNSTFEGEHIYAVVEGATPLLTLYNIFENAAARSRFCEEHKAELIFVFFKTLVYIIQNDARTRDMCHIIYYNDCDKLGNPIDVADIIVAEIENLTSRQNGLTKD